MSVFLEVDKPQCFPVEEMVHKCLVGLLRCYVAKRLGLPILGKCVTGVVAG